MEANFLPKLVPHLFNRSNTRQLQITTSISPMATSSSPMSITADHDDSVSPMHISPQSPMSITGSPPNSHQTLVDSAKTIAILTALVDSDADTAASIFTSIYYASRQDAIKILDILLMGNQQSRSTLTKLINQLFIQNSFTAVTIFKIFARM